MLFEGSCFILTKEKLQLMLSTIADLVRHLKLPEEYMVPIQLSVISISQLPELMPYWGVFHFQFIWFGLLEQLPKFHTEQVDCLSLTLLGFMRTKRFWLTSKKVFLDSLIMNLKLT